MWSFDHVINWKIKNFYLQIGRVEAYGGRHYDPSHVNVYPSGYVVIIC